MPDVMLQCNKCQRIFKSGISIGAGCTGITLTNCQSQCSFCGSVENIPNGTFNAIANGFVDIIKGSHNPLQEIHDILNGLKKIKNSADIVNVPHGDKIEELLKKHKLKIQVAIAIAGVLVALLSQKQKIEINEITIDQKFYNQYNKFMNVKIEK